MKWGRGRGRNVWGQVILSGTVTFQGSGSQLGTFVGVTTKVGVLLVGRGRAAAKYSARHRTALPMAKKYQPKKSIVLGMRNPGSKKPSLTPSPPPACGLCSQAGPHFGDPLLGCVCVGGGEGDQEGIWLYPTVLL